MKRNLRIRQLLLILAIVLISWNVSMGCRSIDVTYFVIQDKETYTNNTGQRVIAIVDSEYHKIVNELTEG